MIPWIRDRLPLAADADEDGEVEVLLSTENEDLTTDFRRWDDVTIGTPWCHTEVWEAPSKPPAPAVRTFRSISRSFDPNGVECFDAIADDGTAWFRYEHDDWRPQRPLPQPDAA